MPFCRSLIYFFIYLRLITYVDILRAENLSSCGIMTESDADLVVEYEDRHGASFPSEGEDPSMSDSNTVNQDQDSFSILDGDSLLEAEGPQLDLPPLFVHVICSVNTKSHHGSMPVQSLPTCLGKTRMSPHQMQNHDCSMNSSVGWSPPHPQTQSLSLSHHHLDAVLIVDVILAGEVISCLENASALQCLDLNELSVTLDLYVLTLPVEIEVMEDFHHNRLKKKKNLPVGH